MRRRRDRQRVDEEERWRGRVLGRVLRSYTWCVGVGVLKAKRGGYQRVGTYEEVRDFRGLSHTLGICALALVMIKWRSLDMTPASAADSTFSSKMPTRCTCKREHRHDHLSKVRRTRMRTEEANQGDLPLELRDKHEVVKVLGGGSRGVVTEAWQLSGGQRTTLRAIRVMYARGKGRVTTDELKWLDYEVGFMACSFSVWYLFISVYHRVL